jgi:hypothetical protein
MTTVLDAALEAQAKVRTSLHFDDWYEGTEEIVAELARV